MKALRKFLAIALLVFFGLPYAPSLFALTRKDEAKLAACCRRNGMHHCTMGVVDDSGVASDTAHFTVQAPQCPCCPATAARDHHGSDPGLFQEPGFFAHLVSHSVPVVQAESKLRIAPDHARGKRGPPVSPNLA